MNTLLPFDTATSELFKDPEFCRAEILQTHGMMSDRATMADPEKSQQLLKGIGLLLIYCPEEMSPLVQALLVNYNMRKLHIGSK